MRRISRRLHEQRGMVLLETIVAAVAALAVLGALISAAITIRKSVAATHQYSVSTADETRLMDYVSQDLRRAVRVGMLSGGTNTPLRNSSNYAVTDTQLLTISVPDYYGSNTPDNGAGSSFKTSRYPRATLNSSGTYNGSATAKLNGIVPWVDAVTTISGKKVVRFAPGSAGTGELQVRYFRGPRSVTDSTVCFFRSEYPSGATVPSLTREIAERISDNVSTTSLIVTGMNNGLSFRLKSSFTPRYRTSGATSAGTDAFVEVSIRNARRD